MKKSILFIITCCIITDMYAGQYGSRLLQGARTALYGLRSGVRTETAQLASAGSWWQQLKTKIESPFKDYFAQRLESQVKLELPKQQMMLNSNPSVGYFKNAQQRFEQALKGQNPIEIEQAAHNLEWTIGLVRRSIQSNRTANAKYATAKYRYISSAFERAIEPLEKEIANVSAELTPKMDSFIEEGQSAKKNMFKDRVQRDIDFFMNAVEQSKPRSLDDAQRLLFEEHTYNEFVQGARDVLGKFKLRAIQNAEKKPLEGWTQFEAEVWKQKVDQALQNLEGREL